MIPAAGSLTGRRELGRYTTSAGSVRLLVGQRIDGQVRVIDVPSCGSGRRYVVERELHSNAELTAIVDDYLERAAVRGACPMRMLP